MLTAELNRTRRIGCEYEMTVPLVGSGSGADVQRTLAHVLTANGLPAISRGYSHEPIPGGVDLAVEFDSSVHGESVYNGISWHSVELKTRILNGIDDWEAIIPKALDICRYMGARVNRSCGHHVHVDFPEAATRPATIRSIYNLMHRFEPLLYGLMAPSRREASGYSAPMPDKSRLLHGCRSMRAFRNALSGWERRFGTNLVHLWEDEPRIEFRYHHGTLDSEKSRHWIRLLNRLVEHAVTRNCQAADKQVSNSRASLDSMRWTVGLRANAGIYAKIASPELKQTSKYLLTRWKKLNTPVVSGDIGAED